MSLSAITFYSRAYSFPNPYQAFAVHWAIEGWRRLSPCTLASQRSITFFTLSELLQQFPKICWPSFEAFLFHNTLFHTGNFGGLQVQWASCSLASWLFHLSPHQTECDNAATLALDPTAEIQNRPEGQGCLHQPQGVLIRPALPSCCGLRIFSYLASWPLPLFTEIGLPLLGSNLLLSWGWDWLPWASHWRNLALTPSGLVWLPQLLNLGSTRPHLGHNTGLIFTLNWFPPQYSTLGGEVCSVFMTGECPESDPWGPALNCLNGSKGHASELLCPGYLLWCCMLGAITHHRFSARLL